MDFYLTGDFAEMNIVVLVYIILALGYLAIGYLLAEKSINLFKKRGNSKLWAIFLYPNLTILKGCFNDKEKMLIPDEVSHFCNKRSFGIDILIEEDYKNCLGEKMYFALHLLFWPLRASADALSIIYVGCKLSFYDWIVVK